MKKIESSDFLGIAVTLALLYFTNNLPVTSTSPSDGFDPSTKAQRHAAVESHDPTTTAELPPGRVGTLNEGQYRGDRRLLFLKENLQKIEQSLYNDAVSCETLLDRAMAPFQDHRLYKILNGLLGPTTYYQFVTPLKELLENPYYITLDENGNEVVTLLEEAVNIPYDLACNIILDNFLDASRRLVDQLFYKESNHKIAALTTSPKLLPGEIDTLKEKQHHHGSAVPPEKPIFAPEEPPECDDCGGGERER